MKKRERPKKSLKIDQQCWKAVQSYWIVLQSVEEIEKDNRRKFRQIVIVQWSEHLGLNEQVTKS